MTYDSATWQYQNPPCGTMKKFGENSFIIQTLISAIHYEHSFWMVLDCDIWCNKKIPLGILIVFWKKNQMNIYLNR
jgi:hypothetical protein